MSSARLLFLTVRFWLEKINRDLSAVVRFRRLSLQTILIFKHIYIVLKITVCTSKCNTYCLSLCQGVIFSK